MTDKADQIMDLLAGVCETLGHPVERDRNYDVHADERGAVPSDLPLIVLRTGEEETAGGTRPESWDVRWVLRPRIEFYLRELDQAAQRTELARVWSEFRVGLKGSPILRLITRGTAPEVSREIDPVLARRDLVVMSINLGFTFDR